MRTWMFASRPSVGPHSLAVLLVDRLELCQHLGQRSCHSGCHEGHRRAILSSHPTGANNVSVLLLAQEGQLTASESSRSLSRPRQEEHAPIFTRGSGND